MTTQERAKEAYNLLTPLIRHAREHTIQYRKDNPGTYDKRAERDIKALSHAKEILGVYCDPCDQPSLPIDEIPV